MRKLISTLVVAASLLVPATSQAYLHVANASQACANASYQSANASSLATWGSTTRHDSAFYNNYGRYSDSHVWVDIGWITNDYHNIYTYCDVSGSDASPSVNSIGVHY